MLYMYTIYFSVVAHDCVIDQLNKNMIHSNTRTRSHCHWVLSFEDFKRTEPMYKNNPHLRTYMYMNAFTILLLICYEACLKNEGAIREMTVAFSCILFPV